MGIKLSKALRNYALAFGGVRAALNGGRILLYTGTAPTNAEDAPSGTLLATLTSNAGAYTAEVRATGTITLTGGASGSINTVAVGGIGNLIPNGTVPFNTSLTQTAADLASAINANWSGAGWQATSSGAVVTLLSPVGVGASNNGGNINVGTTTITTSIVAISGGTSWANGLHLGAGVSGILQKDPTQIWSGVGVVASTIGYARFIGPLADTLALDSSETFPRLQMDVGTTGSTLNMTSLQTTVGVLATVTGFSITMPAS